MPPAGFVKPWPGGRAATKRRPGRLTRDSTRSMAQGGAVGAVSFNGVLVIGLVAVAVPALCALVPGLPVPGAVLEVVAGIIVGPSVLGWVHVDAAVQVLSDLGLGMLLFLAGLEIDVGRLRGPLGRVAGMAFAVSAVL